jgi:hypothetical protein
VALPAPVVLAYATGNVLLIPVSQKFQIVKRMMNDKHARPIDNLLAELAEYNATIVPPSADSSSDSETNCHHSNPCENTCFTS